MWTIILGTLEVQVDLSQTPAAAGPVADLNKCLFATKGWPIPEDVH